MPIVVSGSQGTTIISGSGATVSGSAGVQTYISASEAGQVDISGSLAVFGTNETLLGVDGAATGSVLFVTGSKRVGIGTSTPAYRLDVSGNIGVGDSEPGTGYIFHNGDDDTYIQFSDDEMILYAGGRAFVKMEETGQDKLTINHGGMDLDLQIKGENIANLIRTIAEHDTVGIGASPADGVLLHVSSSSDEEIFRVDGSTAGTIFEVSGSGVVSVTGQLSASTASIESGLDVGGPITALALTASSGVQATDLLIHTTASVVDLHVSGTLTVTGSEFEGPVQQILDNHTSYFLINVDEHGSLTSFGASSEEVEHDASFYVSGAIGGKDLEEGVTVFGGDLQVSGNIYNTLADGTTTHFSPYLAQQILDPSSYALFTITNNSTTLYKVDWDTGATSCTDPSVTFTAPPSGKVLVDVHIYIDDTSTSGPGPYVYLALSTSTAANIGNTDGSIVGVEKIIWYPDEADDGVRTLTFYASGLTSGTSYTWNLYTRRWTDGDTNRIICGGAYPALIMQVRPIMDNADIYTT